MGGASRGGSLVLWQVYYGVVSSVFCPRNGLVVVLMGPLLKLSKFYSDGVVVKKGFVVRGKGRRQNPSRDVHHDFNLALTAKLMPSLKPRHANRLASPDFYF